MKAIQRLALFGIDGPHIPLDLPPLTNNRACECYLRPEVGRRIERLIERAGKVWDHDPRIAYVEMGVLAKYGKQWDLSNYPSLINLVVARLNCQGGELVRNVSIGPSDK